MKDWKVIVKYKDGTLTEHIVKDSEEASKESIAVLLQRELIPKEVLPVPTERDEKEKTVHRLAYYGYTIESIEEIKE